MKIALVDVDGHSGFTHYDRVYLSKVFTFSPDFDTVIDADEIITGGTGYKDYTSLPPEVEATPPDYSIYPHYKRAIGFLTRGCIRACPWCIVPRKEGYIHPAATWEQIKRPDSREIIFLDNNVLALERMGITLFAQPYRDYDGGEPPNEQKAFARWVNIRSVCGGFLCLFAFLPALYAGTV